MHSNLDTIQDSYTPAERETVSTARCSLAKGEFESIQVGIHATEGGLSNVRIQVESDLDVRVYHHFRSTPSPQLESVPLLIEGDTIQEIPAGKSNAFWVTFHAPIDVKAGVHRGKIRIAPEGVVATELDLEVRVMPFELQPSKALFAMYFAESFVPNSPGTNEWLTAVYRDMAEHGQNGVTFYEGGDFSSLPPKKSRMVDVYIPLAKKAGLTRVDQPCISLSSNLNRLGDTSKDMAAVRWLEQECERQGWPPIILYSFDEPAHPHSRLRKMYEPWRTMPMQLTTAMEIHGAYGYGDLHDLWIVYGGHITPEMSAEAERLGARVGTYSFTILRNGHIPCRQRYYSGLYTWANKLSANTIWAYHDGYHSHAWFPTPESVPMPTPGWEARREGIDDYRYLQTLEACISAKQENPTAVKAARWLDGLRKKIVMDPHDVDPDKPFAFDDYDNIRTTAAGYIEKLGPVPLAPVRRPPVVRVKDEAKSFRGKSVKECTAGLSDRRAELRRAAATALMELGPEAAPAAKALSRTLDDPKVRMPALHALEAIGPGAISTAPRIAKLLEHPDAFVRIGAVYALFGMGEKLVQGPYETLCLSVSTASTGKSPAFDPLRRALNDPFPPVAFAAGKGLFRLGPAALPALPDAIELLDRPGWEYQHGGLKTIAGTGREAKAAVPKLVGMFEKSKGADHYVARTLAAIGPEAREALPVLEKFAADGSNSSRFLANYVLFCINSDESALRDMTAQLQAQATYWQKQEIVVYLYALGASAAPVADTVRQMLASGEPDLADFKGDLEAFLRRVEKGEAPLIVMP